MRRCILLAYACLFIGCGEAAPRLLTTEVSGGDLAAGGDSVYDDEVLAAPKVPDEREPSIVATAQTEPDELVLADDTLYWITADGFLRRVATSGGTPEDVGAAYSGFDASVAFDGDGVYWTGPDGLMMLPR